MSGQSARCICTRPGSSVQCVACYPDLARKFNEARADRCLNDSGCDGRSHSIHCNEAFWGKR